jgi:hypothetical protein
MPNKDGAERGCVWEHGWLRSWFSKRVEKVHWWLTPLAVTEPTLHACCWQIEAGVGSGQESRDGSSPSCVSVMTDPHTGGPCSFLRELPRLASVRLASREDGSEGSG